MSTTGGLGAPALLECVKPAFQGGDDMGVRVVFFVWLGGLFGGKEAVDFLDGGLIVNEGRQGLLRGLFLCSECEIGRDEFTLEGLKPLEEPLVFRLFLKKAVIDGNGLLQVSLVGVELRQGFCGLGLRWFFRGRPSGRWPWRAWRRASC